MAEVAHADIGGHDAVGIESGVQAAVGVIADDDDISVAAIINVTYRHDFTVSPG